MLAFAALVLTTGIGAAPESGAPPRDGARSSLPRVSEILRDGQGDFDPWNEVRWAGWYQNGKLSRPFDIDGSLRFAARGGAWTPDLTGLADGKVLFTVSRPGTVIDGNGVVIDGNLAKYGKRSLDQIYAGGSSEANLSRGLAAGFSFRTALVAGSPENQLRNLALKGFVQAVQVARTNTHPLVLALNTFSRNNTGVYINGTNVTVTGCAFFENASTASYNGNGSHHNRFVGNLFRDNNYTLNPAYGDLVFDSSYGNEAVSNRFMPSQASAAHMRVALAFFRNAGEDGRLREDYPRENNIENNMITGYSVAMNLGSRQGRAEHVHDLAKEGRDYAASNRLRRNTIRDSAIGIKLNTSGNMIEGNVFMNVAHPIVLHCVTYNLLATTINKQPGTAVRCWTDKSDYTDYAGWFPYQTALMNAIPAREKLIQVRTDDDTPVFGSSGAAAFLKAPSLLADATMTGIHSTGCQPIGLAAGDFYDNQAGDEVAVIWDKPNTRVGGAAYYDIIFYDGDGTEINRAGRSPAGWGGLVAGKFTGRRGEQVAVFATKAVNGAWPVYIFRRGFLKPDHVILTDNPHKIRAIAAGNFRPDDDLDEIAVIFESGPSAIVFAKPTDNTWTSSAASAIRLSGIAGGRFDPAQAGGQVAAIGAEADAGSGSYPIYFFEPGASGPYAMAAAGTGRPWTAIGSGDFDPMRDGEEVAVCGSEVFKGIYQIQCLAPGAMTAFKTVSFPVMGVPARNLAGGRPMARTTLSDYERAEGIASPDYADELSRWGEAIVVLPSARQSGAIPVFWLNSAPADGTKRYLKVTPVVR
jgi:hypothetical protein